MPEQKKFICLQERSPFTSKSCFLKRFIDAYIISYIVYTTYKTSNNTCNLNSCQEAYLQFRRRCQNADDWIRDRLVRLENETMATSDLSMILGPILLC